MLKLTGWVEVDGQRLSPQEIETIVKDRPEEILSFGGEFFLAGSGCRARDHFGIMPGNCPKGTLICDDVVKGSINPHVPDLPLEEAIITAVNLRSDEGVCALSGGVDSTLVAHLAGRECVAVGLLDSHDLHQARYAADTLGLSCFYVTITSKEVEAALPAVIGAIPLKDPVNTSIALTQYFVARYAGEQGYKRIITGQGADELFGGYLPVPGNTHAPRRPRTGFSRARTAGRPGPVSCSAPWNELFHALPGRAGGARCTRDPGP